MNLKPIKRISDSSRQRLAGNVTAAQDTARLRISSLPEPFGLNRLYDGHSPLSQELATLLKPAIQKYVCDFFSGTPATKVKGTEFWRKFVPESPSIDELKAIQLALSPRYYWSDFINLPEVRKALVEDAAYGLVDVLVGTVDFINGEKALLKEWEKERPVYHDFANKNTLAYISKVYSASDKNDPECSDGLAAVWRARMSAFRILDAHFTGHQVFDPNPRIGGVDHVYRKLNIGFASKLPQDQQLDVEKRFGFLKVGDVQSAKYGVSQRNTDAKYLDMAYAEVDPKSPSFNFQNLVTQVTSFIAPVLTLPPEKVKQKGLVSIKFLYNLYTKAEEIKKMEAKNPLPEIDMQEVYIDLKDVGENLETRFSPEWCRKRFISPAWLAFAGFRPLIHKQYREALGVVLEGLPEFAEQLKSKEMEDALVQLRTRKVVLEPVLARGIQKECLNLYQVANPKAYQETVERVKKKYRSEREVDRVSGDSKALHACFLEAVKFLGDSPEITSKLLEEKYGQGKEPIKPIYVAVPTSCMWEHTSITEGFPLI